jgi:hypothetical protein
MGDHKDLPVCVNGFVANHGPATDSTVSYRKLRQSRAWRRAGHTSPEATPAAF